MTYQKDPRVDEYIDALPAWQQDICRQVRDLVHAVDPEVAETIKRRVQPYFVLNGNICALLAAKDHVNVFLYDPIVPIRRASSPAATTTSRPHGRRTPERDNQHPSPRRDIPADHRQQSRRRMAQDQPRRPMNTPGAPVNGRPIPPQAWHLDAASLADANKTLRILPRDLRPYRRGIHMVGRAVTVTASADLVPVLAGLEQCGAGEVLVVDAGTTDDAVLGELFATEALRREMAGIVVYGLCRDTAVLASSHCPSTPSARFHAPPERRGFR